MTEVSKIRVGLVDDQALVRTGFAMVIDSQDDMKVVLEASNGKIALERLTVVPADVILMDIRMPVMDGLEATATITSKPLPTGVSPKILILTTFEEEEYIMGAVQAGASGFQSVKPGSPRSPARCRTVASWASSTTATGLSCRLEVPARSR